MNIKKIMLLGGSGFVGSFLANRLTQQGFSVTIPSRRPERARALLPIPGIELLGADIHDPEQLTRLVRGHDVVINLVGILHSRDVKFPYSRDFAKAHVELPNKVIAACRANGVRRLLQMSALNAAPDAPSEYLASKGDGEAAVLAASDLDVTVFRPSVIFGRDDVFLNTFAKILRLAPVFPLGFGRAKFQPVYVGDVADAFLAALDNAASFGQAYDLCGPHSYTLRQLVDYVGKLSGHPARIIPLCDSLAYLQAGLMWLAPKPLLSPDNLRSMEVDSVCSDTCRRPPNWSPQPLEEVAPTYLAPQAAKARFNTFRLHSGR